MYAVTGIRGEWWAIFLKHGDSWVALDMFGSQGFLLSTPVGVKHSLGQAG